MVPLDRLKLPMTWSLKNISTTFTRCLSNYLTSLEFTLVSFHRLLFFSVIKIYWLVFCKCYIYSPIIGRYFDPCIFCPCINIATLLLKLYILPLHGVNSVHYFTRYITLTSGYVTNPRQLKPCHLYRKFLCHLH